MRKMVYPLVFLAMQLNPPSALALAQADYCQLMAEVGVETLEMLDRNVGVDEAISVIVAKYSEKDPSLSLGDTVRVLYSRGSTLGRGDEYRRSYLEIC